MNETPNTSDPRALEKAFLDLWRTLKAYRCDLNKLPQGIASHPVLQKPSLTGLFDLAEQEKTPALRASLEQALGITTRHHGIALQMWWFQVAWLKRRLLDCAGIAWQATDITRRPITIEEALAAYQLHSSSRKPTHP